MAAEYIGVVPGREVKGSGLDVGQKTQTQMPQVKGILDSIGGIQKPFQKGGEQHSPKEMVELFSSITLSSHTLNAVSAVSDAFAWIHVYEMTSRKEEEEVAKKFSTDIIGERIDKLKTANEILAVFEGMKEGRSEVWAKHQLEEKQKEEKLKEEQRIKEMVRVGPAGIRVREAAVREEAAKTALAEEDAHQLESLRKKWEDLLKEKEMAALEKDAKKRKKIEEELERRMRALVEETRKRVEDVYKRLYGARASLLKDAIAKAEELLKAGKSKGEIEAAILKALEKDPALRKMVEKDLPLARTAGGVVSLLRRILLALLGEPLCKRLEKLLGTLKEKEPDGKEVVRLLRTIAMLGRLRSLMKKLEKAMKEGASDAEIAAILKEIDASIPLTELGDDISEILELRGDEFRKKAEKIWRSLKGEVDVATAMDSAIRSGDPAAVGRAATLIKEIYEQLVPDMKEKAEEIASGTASEKEKSARIAKMIEESISGFGKKIK